MSVKWGQKYPFNIKIPQDSSWVNNMYNDYRGLPPVGCSNVALGQILATIKQPSRAPGVNTTYDWGGAKKSFKLLQSYELSSRARHRELSVLYESYLNEQG